MKRVSKRQAWMLCGVIVLYVGMLMLSARLKPNFFENESLPQAVSHAVGSPGILVHFSDHGLVRWFEMNQDIPDSTTPKTLKLLDDNAVDWLQENWLQMGRELDINFLAEGVGSLIALKVLEDLSWSPRSLTLVNPRGLESYDLLGSQVIDQPLRAVESFVFRVIDVGVPFVWTTGLPIRDRAWKAHLRSRESLSDAWFEGRLFPFEVVVLSADPEDGESDKFRKLLVRSVRSNGSAPESSTEQYSDDAEVKFPISETDITWAPRRFDGWELGVAVVLLAASTLISEDLACIGAGILVAQGILGWEWAVIACIIGIFFGDLAVYLLGRVWGVSLLRHRPLRWLVSEGALVSSEKWFKRSGIWVLLASRFMPGTRLPVYFAAGMLKARLSLVSLVLLGGALFWVPAMVGIAYLVGDQVVFWVEKYESMGLWVLVAATLLIFVGVHQMLPLFTFRGRRLLYGRLRRVFHWQFWPAWIVYFPIALWWLLLGVRYRSFTLCTLANPMVPYGGIFRESKSGLLDTLRKAGAPVISSVCLNPMDRTSLVDAIMPNQCPGAQGSFPLLVKPDEGGRGRGVRMIWDAEQWTEFLSGFDRTFIVQPYCSGKEFAINYQRLAWEERGRITSVTRKIPLSVEGDGNRSLEQLILTDSRAVCHAPRLLKDFAKRLFEVPPEGEVVILDETCTHAGGSLFINSNHLLTPELNEFFENFCGRIDGLYLARFDVTAPSEQQLLKGLDIRITEMNLLTAEPAQIYDPKSSVFHAWSHLAAHWLSAYSVGYHLRKSGQKTCGTFAVLGKLLKQLWR